MGAAPANVVSQHEQPVIQAATTVTAKPWIWRIVNTLLYYVELPFLFLDRGVGRSYLEGGFAPAHNELFAGNLQIIEGEVPTSLPSGCFLRNGETLPPGGAAPPHCASARRLPLCPAGPNPQFDVPGSYHWFDGDGMVHSVCIRGGKATYSNRYVQTPRLRQEQLAGYAAAGRLGKMKGTRGLVNMGLDKLKHLAGILDSANGLGTANTALAYHAGRLLALNEVEVALPPMACQRAAWSRRRHERAATSPRISADRAFRRALQATCRTRCDWHATVWCPPSGG